MSKVLLLGGQAESLLNFRGILIQEMISQGHKVYAAAPDMDKATAYKLAGLGAIPVEAPLSRTAINPLKDMQSTWALWRLMREIKPDFFIAYTIKPVIFGSIAARLANVKNITAMITGLGYAFIEGNEAKRKITRRFAVLLYRMALPLSRKVLFQNPDDRQVFFDLKILGTSSDTAIINGSGVDILHYDVKPLPANPRFLMISRFLIDKGVREYAGAVKQLKLKFPEAQAALAGYVDSSPNSITQAELESWQPDGLELVGKLDDVRDEIARSSIIVLPSYREGTPRVVLEAMAMGRAIVTTDAPGCRETVTDGVNGLLVPVRNADALGDAMCKLYADADLVAKMALAGRKIAETRYDARLVARDIMSHAGLSLEAVAG